MFSIRKSTSFRAGTGIACILPCLLFYAFYERVRPSTNTEYSPTVIITPIDYMKVYNPDCEKFKGDVESLDYFNYVNSHLDSPIKISPRTSAFLNVKYHFAVITAPKNFLARKVIRKTWMRTLEENMTKGRRNCSASAKFYVGQTSDPAVAQKLHQEMQDHSDIIFIEFCDSYGFLSLKTFNVMKSVMVSGGPFLEWVVKIDDDMLPNFPAFFDCFPTVSLDDYGIYGWVTEAAATHDKKSKYRVSSQSWNQSRFPPFAHGPSYAVRTSVLPELVSTARKIPVLNLEDVWFTGIVAAAAKVKILDVPGFIVVDKTTDDFLANEHHAEGEGFFYHNAVPKVIEILWEDASAIQKCCDCHRHCSSFSPQNFL